MHMGDADPCSRQQWGVMRGISVWCLWYMAAHADLPLFFPSLLTTATGSWTFPLTMELEMKHDVANHEDDNSQDQLSQHDWIHLQALPWSGCVQTEVPRSAPLGLYRQGSHSRHSRTAWSLPTIQNGQTTQNEVMPPNSQQPNPNAQPSTHKSSSPPQLTTADDSKRLHRTSLNAGSLSPST